MSEPPRPPQRATALRYHGGDGAPEVVASGRGLIAERLLEEARRAGVPVRRDPALAEALGQLELGREIPFELYAAVAETLAWAYRLDARRSRRPLTPALAGFKPGARRPITRSVPSGGVVPWLFA